MSNSFGARDTLTVGGREHEIYRLDALQERFDVARLPYSLKVLLENALRLEDGVAVTEDAIETIATWDASAEPSKEIPFQPSRVLMQDFTGVPAVVDLAAMRDAMEELGGDPSRINPLVPADLVIDHSVQVDVFGTPTALQRNAELEFKRNRERYEFLRWGQTAFDNFRVVPPATGICHQVNLEYLGQVVWSRENDGTLQAYFDTLVGTDSHTTMINGLGILGWGVGGIEAEAALLGQPVSMLLPQVIGFKLHGALSEGATATDLVLRVTEMLRERGVVGRFVEFYGPGISGLGLADRATIGNMSPEFGSTCAIFPVDAETLRYLEFTGRPTEQIELVDAYAREQGVFHDDDTEDPTFTDLLELDLGDVVPSIAGPKRPQDRIALTDSKAAFLEHFAKDVSTDGHDAAVAETFPASDPPSNGSPGHEDTTGAGDEEDTSGSRTEKPSEPGREAPGDGGVATREKAATVPVNVEGVDTEVGDGYVVIAAITSCTNTSNPSVMLAAGLVAQKAVERGLEVKPWVKTSLAPGSTVVTEYLEKSGLDEPLEKLRFHTVGYGCTTCIGNSGPLPEAVSEAVNEHDLVVCSVLSGNRNFEGRINQDVRANYLASPPLVVAYALAGRMDVDLTTEALGQGPDGEDVFLSDLWPTQEEISDAVAASVEKQMFERSYADVFTGDETWRAIDVPEGDRYTWPDSTYVRRPSFFEGMDAEPGGVEPIEGARILAKLGQSITTDHISPAGAIKKQSPAGEWLMEQGVEPGDFNSYGSRRGNHEVMVRGTFANIRLRNELVEREGGWTRHLPSNDEMPIYDAAVRYREEGVPLVVIAGPEYGSGSSRDWAAKGTFLQGVRAVIAESFERIHRSNLIGMGVLPLQFPEGETIEGLGLTGEEVVDVGDIQGGEAKTVTVTFTPEDGDTIEVEAVVRIDTPNEISYFQNGGILHYVLRKLRDEPKK